MFQFPGFASRLGLDDRIAPVGLPHSEIRASMGICPSARLIAACHVLLRLREPRHPSCALLSFPLTLPSLVFYSLADVSYPLRSLNRRARELFLGLRFFDLSVVGFDAATRRSLVCIPICQCAPFLSETVVGYDGGSCML